MISFQRNKQQQQHMLNILEEKRVQLEILQKKSDEAVNNFNDVIQQLKEINADIQVQTNDIRRIVSELIETKIILEDTEMANEILIRKFEDLFS